MTFSKGDGTFPSQQKKNKFLCTSNYLIWLG